MLEQPKPKCVKRGLSCGYTTCIEIKGSKTAEELADKYKHKFTNEESLNAFQSGLIEGKTVSLEVLAKVLQDMKPSSGYLITPQVFNRIFDEVFSKVKDELT